jgi:chromosome segregation ATPase
MTTEDIIKDLRYLCDQPACAGVSETMTLAANAIEGLGLRFDECMQKHNDTRAELERMKTELAQAISERTPHDYGILQNQRDDCRERLGVAAKEVFDLEAKVKLLTTERDGYFSEMERMQRGWNGANQEVLRLEDHLEDLKKAAITNLTAAVALIRPEPSRLEIAAMFLANDRAYEGPTMALKRADALIAAAKEVTK